MAAQPLVAGLPPDLSLTDSYVVRISALDPTTGAAVAGVNISGMTIQAINLTGGPAADLQVLPFLVPQTGP